MFKLLKDIVAKFDKSVSYKSFAICCVSALFLYAGVVAMTVYLVDPFGYFSKRKITIQRATEARKLAVGIIKYYDFKSILVGSSMSQNFLMSDLSKIAPEPMKITDGGIMAYEIENILRYAFKYKPNLNTVIINIDFFAMTYDQNQMDRSLYDFLFNERPYDIFSKYLLSGKNFKNALKVFKQDIKDNYQEVDYERLFFWDSDKIKYGKQAVYKNVENILNKQAINFNFSYPWTKERMINTFNEYVLPFIKSYPDTKFILFYPPYSIASWWAYKKFNVLTDEIEFKAALASELASFKNVQLFDFQDDLKTITNLDIYRDADHYNSKINTLMANEMSFGAKSHYFVGNLSAYKTRLDKFVDFVMGYELDKRTE